MKEYRNRNPFAVNEETKLSGHNTPLTVNENKSVELKDRARS